MEASVICHTSAYPSPPEAMAPNIMCEIEANGNCCVYCYRHKLPAKYRGERPGDRTF